MTLVPDRFIVQAVARDVDDEGNVAGEVQLEPVVLFGCDQLAKWAGLFPDKLAAAKPSAEATADQQR